MTFEFSQFSREITMDITRDFTDFLMTFEFPQFSREITMNT